MAWWRGAGASSGELDEATEEFVWLWEHLLEHEPAMNGVRLSFMAGDMQQLAERHEPARQAFRKLRDRQSAAVDGTNSGKQDVIDWLHLNQVIGDQEDTLRWYDRIKGRPSAAAQFQPVETALSAGQPRPQQRLWIEEAQAVGEPQDALRRRLEEALASK